MGTTDNWKVTNIKVTTEQLPSGKTIYFGVDMSRPGCMAQGDTLLEMRSSLREAQELYDSVIPLKEQTE